MAAITDRERRRAMRELASSASERAEQKRRWAHGYREQSAAASDVEHALRLSDMALMYERNAVMTERRARGTAERWPL